MQGGKAWVRRAYSVALNGLWNGVVSVLWKTAIQESKCIHMKTDVATRPVYAVQEKLKAKSSKIPQGNKTDNNTDKSGKQNTTQKKKLKSRPCGRSRNRRIARPLIKGGNAAQHAPTSTIHLQAVLRHNANKATTLGGADHSAERLGELSAPAACQEGHPTRSRTHGGSIETQLVVTPPIGKRGGGTDSRRAGQRMLDKHSVQHCRVTNSAHASAKHEHRIELNIVGEIGSRRAVRHATSSRSDASQRDANRSTQPHHIRVRAVQQQVR